MPLLHPIESMDFWQTPSISDRRIPSAGEDVEVYYNFHKKCLSIRNSDGYVAAYADSIRLGGVEFHVSDAGRERTRREECKNVHAVVRGRLANKKPKDNGVLVKYNPYEYDQFTAVEEDVEVFEANDVSIIGTDIWMHR